MRNKICFVWYPLVRVFPAFNRCFAVITIISAINHVLPSLIKQADLSVALRLSWYVLTMYARMIFAVFGIFVAFPRYVKGVYLAKVKLFACLTYGCLLYDDVALFAYGFRLILRYAVDAVPAIVFHVVYLYLKSAKSFTL